MRQNRHPVYTGLCCIPALLLATGTLLEGTVIGIMLAVCLLLASIISLLPTAQVNETRITLGVLFPALFAAFATLIAYSFFPWLTENRGWLVPLSILSLGLAEMFSKDISSSETHETLRDSIHSSLSLFLTFLLFAFCRELLTYGTLMAYPGGKGGISLPWLSDSVRPFFGSVAGGLLLLALFTVAWRCIEDRRVIAAARKQAIRDTEEDDDFSDVDMPELPEVPPEETVVSPVEHVEQVDPEDNGETSSLPEEETVAEMPSEQDVSSDVPSSPDAETEVEAP